MAALVIAVFFITWCRNNAAAPEDYRPLQSYSELGVGADIFSLDAPTRVESVSGNGEQAIDDGTESGFVWIVGAVRFSDSSIGNGSNFPLFVVTEVDARGVEDIRSVPTLHLAGGKLTVIPVGPLGNFRFQVSSAHTSVKLGAAGSGVVGSADVVATPGVPCTVIMDYLYALDVMYLDADAASPIEDKLAFHFVREPTTYSYLDRCLPGIRSALARAFVLRDLPLSPETSGTRHLVTGQQRLEDGVRLGLSLNTPGYQSQHLELRLPLLVKSIPVQRVLLDRVKGPLTRIELSIERPGDWEAVAGYEYRSIARFLMFRIGEEFADFEVSGLDLRPGVRLIPEQPLLEPVCQLILGAHLVTRDESQLARHPLLVERSSPELLATRFDGAGVAAVVIPPFGPRSDEHAWLGVRRLENDQIAGYRYQPERGIVLDGILPGRYQVYWSPDRLKYFSSIEARLPLLDLELRPGLNWLPIPE